MQPVTVDERHTQTLREQRAEGRLADTLHPHHDDRDARLLRHAQPFVAPAVSPDTMYRWVKSAMSMIGVVTTTDAAMSAPQSIDA